MRLKKIIVPIILFLLLAGILLIRPGLRPQSSPAPSSAPSVLTGATSSATAVTTAQQTGASFLPIHYTTDNSKPIKAKKDNKMELTGKKAVIKTDDGILYIIQRDGTVDKFHPEKGEYTDAYQTKSWLYYTVEDYDDTTTLYRAPIQRQGKKTIPLLKERERLKTDLAGILYATDQYVIYDTDDNTNDSIKYTVKSKKSERIVFSSDEEADISWSCIYGPNQEQIMEKNGDIYMEEEIDDDYDGLANRICFYKFNVDTLQKTKLSERTNAVLSDPSGQIVLMESDETWNYAYYPETGKRFQCGQNMMKEWGTDDDQNYYIFDEDSVTEYLPCTTNRDLVSWIRENNPWGYQEKNGEFYCVNSFVYNGRMYVKVRFVWINSQEETDNVYGDCDGKEAHMFFSYSLKNYEGIRPEIEINHIIQKYFSNTFDDDTGRYFYNSIRKRFNDILVLGYDDFCVLYHLKTGEYRKIEGKNRDLLYLKELF